MVIGLKKSCSLLTSAKTMVTLRAEEINRITDLGNTAQQECLSLLPSDQGAVIRMKTLDLRDEIRMAQVRNRLGTGGVEELGMVGCDRRSALFGKVTHIDDKRRRRVRGKHKEENGCRPEAFLSCLDFGQPRVVGSFDDEPTRMDVIGMTVIPMVGQHNRRPVFSQ